MRTATPETRRALRAAVAEYASRRQWAIAHDIAPVDVSDCLNGRPVSAQRENRLRAALGLAPLRWQVVELLENQRVVTVTRPRDNVRRAATMTRELAAYADKLAAERGYRSFGAMAISELLRDGSVDALYTPSARRNGNGHTCEQDSYDRPTTATN